MKKYETKIANEFLKKYYRRETAHRDSTIHRNIYLTTDKLLKNYSEYNVELEEKERVNNAIKSLASKGFITTAKLKYSDDYEKVSLIEENISSFEEYAMKELGITPRTFIVNELSGIIRTMKHKGMILEFYIDGIEDAIQNSAVQLDVTKEKDILNILSFLENNHRFLYIREASMLIFGDSKYLEINRKNQVCSVLMKYFEKNGEEIFEDENLLERFNVYDTDQEICIKGAVSINIENREIDIDGLNGGVSFSNKDIERINSILVKNKKVITIENKTSFLRAAEGCCCVYLGGFATRPQISFIKKLINDNPRCEYHHFGDIDAGGFWIHKKLCEQTGKAFKTYHMSKEDLMNPTYADCLKKLSNQDRKRLLKLKDDELYKECIEYMLENNVKLEQEIISLSIC